MGRWKNKYVAEATCKVLFANFTKSFHPAKRSLFFLNYAALVITTVAVMKLC